jgi:hypothetical protein
VKKYDNPPVVEEEYGSPITKNNADIKFITHDAFLE